MKIIIVGGSFAGINCALEARSLYPEAEIRVFESQAEVGFIPSGLNLLLNEDIKELKEAVFMSEHDIRKADIILHLETSVQAIDMDNQKVEVCRTLPEASLETYDYDYLVLAMGSKQTSGQWDLQEDSRIITTKSFAAAQQSAELLKNEQFITVIGGGQIGIEATEALINANKQVQLIEQANHLIPRYFDQDFIESIEETIAFTGVDLLLGEKVEAIDFDDQVMITTDKGQYATDAVLLGVNLIPNSSLVEDLVDVNDDRTILVNDYLQTSQGKVFAIGDLVQTPVGDLNQESFIALVNHAVRTGQIAAHNLIRPRVKQEKSLRVIGSRVFSQYIVSVGLTEAEAKGAYDYQVIQVAEDFSLTKAQAVHLKLVVDQENGRLLGAQVRSEANILHLADVLSLAIANGLRDEQVAFQDRLYYPRYTAMQPIIYQAALASVKKRRKSGDTYGQI